MELLIKSYDYKATFVIHEENLKSLKSTITMFKDNLFTQLEEDTFTFKSEFVAKHVANNLKNVNIMIPPKLLDNTILIRGEPKLID